MERETRPNYVTEWFGAVPARWYGMLGVLVALVTMVVLAAVWVNEKGLAWWWIWLGIIVSILFVVFSFLAYRKVALERDRIVGEKDSITTEKDRIAQELATTKEQLVPLHQYVSDSHIRGRNVHLIDLIAPGAKPVITERIIEDCEVRGPAMIALLGQVTIADCSWDGDLNSLFVEVSKDRMIFGAIGLQHCVFRRCRFAAIGIIGTREQIETIKKGFKSQS